jgi:hypothetical protein
VTGLPEEFTAKQWALHQRAVPHAVIICGGKARRQPCQGFGFVCRADEHSCGRFICACEGGSTDNRCSECWCNHAKAQKRLPRRRREVEFL